ncbi:MAG: hypothetical protein AAFQ09_09140 [Pseudomonadota bacterium]
MDTHYLAVLLIVGATMSEAQDYSFDRHCGVRSDDGAVVIRILDHLEDLAPAAKDRIAAGLHEGDVVHLPGLAITHNNPVTLLDITDPAWMTLGGLRVGITTRELKSAGGKPFDAFGNPAEDSHRICVVNVETQDDRVTQITVAHAPMNIHWEDAPGPENP